MKTFATSLFIIFLTFRLTAQISPLEKGKELLKQEKYSEAQQLLEKTLKTRQNNAELYYLLGKTELMLNHTDVAEKHLNKAIELDELNSEYYILKGNIYTQKIQSVTAFEKLVWANKSLSSYQKAVAVNPNDVKARIHLANYYIQAPAIAGGSIKKANEQATETLNLDKEQGHLLFAQIYSYEKNYDLALESYKKALAANAKNPETYYEIGMIHQSKKNYKEAFACFKQAVELNPKAYNSMYQLGRTSVFSGQNLELGIASLNKYITLQPDGFYPPLDGAYWRLGMLYEKQGELNLAKSSFKKAIEINPEDTNYKQALSALE